MEPKHKNLLMAALDLIEGEYLRLYWNKHQEEADSPFRNTGASYKNNVFAVQAHRWDDEEGQEPNFLYRKTGFSASWYKHSHRGLYAGQNIDAEFIADMLNNCLASLREDFGGKEETSDRD